MRLRFPALGLALLVPLLTSCGGDSTSAPVPSRIVITPGSASLDALGLTQEFSAVVEDGKGRPISDAVVTWMSSNPLVATVSAGGMATGISRGTASVQASAGGITGSATLTVGQTPASVDIVAGDGQTGALSQPLAQELSVEVKDSQGNPISGQSVTFGIVAGSGTMNPQIPTTNAQGIATTTWTLGCSNDNPQRVQARAGSLSVEFTAQADLALPAICDTTVPDGRVTLPYVAGLVVAGGDQGTMAWSLASGTLPPGLSLTPDGALAGTPTTEGSYAFSALAQDGMGASASAEFSLRICQAPISLVPGGSVSVPATGPDGCGILLPTGNAGDRYRLGVIWSTYDDEETTNLPTVRVAANRLLPAGVSPRFSPVRISDPSPAAQGEWLEGLPGDFQKALRVADATEAFHHQLRLQEREMLRAMGPDARPLPDRTRELRTLSSPQRVAPEKRAFFPYNPACEASAMTVGLKVAEDDRMVFYQDSAQAQVDSLSISASLVQELLDYYRDYGEEVIQEYFGGITDINGDGQVVVLVTPDVGEDVAAFVWSGDFFPTAQCSSSNEMELIRFGAPTLRGMLNGNYQSLATLVHETKHVSSLYRALGRWAASGRTDSYQPLWVEEGTAEIAGEMSSRLAWAADGGPGVGETIVRADKVITRESYGVLLRLARTIFHLGIQPNGLVASPEVTEDDHTVYGSGWHFHRWLGDAYGHAALTPKNDAPLFVSLNDSLTASGPLGIMEVTGKTWNALVEEYVSAFLLNGTGAPEPTWGITSYDFPDITNGLLNGQRDGIYPWAVNVSGDDTTMTFQSFVNQGLIGPSGIRVYDVTSDGMGTGLEIEVETTRDPVKVIIVRIQ